MGKTSSEVKQRWETRTYKKYLVRLRAGEDKDLIGFIERNKPAYGTTELFRVAIEKLKNEGLN